MAKRLVGKQPPKELRKRLRTKQSVTTSSAAPTEAAAPLSEAAIATYDDMLRKIYYDVREGFGSIDATLKAAKTRSNYNKSNC